MNVLPKGWVETTLDKVCDVLDSRRVPANAKERAGRLGTVPYFGATGQVGWIDRPLFNEELPLLGEDGAPFLDASKPKAYLIRGPAWVNNHAHVLRARTVTSTRFLLHALNWTDYRRFVNGTTRLKLTQATMNVIPVPLPPLAEQERIVAAIEEQLSRLDRAEQLLRIARRRADRMRASGLAAVTPADCKWTTLGEIAEIVGGVTKDSKRQADPSFVEMPYPGSRTCSGVTWTCARSPRSGCHLRRRRRFVLNQETSCSMRAVIATSLVGDGSGRARSMTASTRTMCSGPDSSRTQPTRSTYPCMATRLVSSGSRRWASRPRTWHRST